MLITHHTYGGTVLNIVLACDVIQWRTQHGVLEVQTPPEMLGKLILDRKGLMGWVGLSVRPSVRLSVTPLLQQLEKHMFKENK
jgi:hypothetical protein